MFSNLIFFILVQVLSPIGATLSPTDSNFIFVKLKFSIDWAVHLDIIPTKFPIVFFISISLKFIFFNSLLIVENIPEYALLVVVDKLDIVGGFSWLPTNLPISNLRGTFNVSPFNVWISVKFTSPVSL